MREERGIRDTCDRGEEAIPRALVGEMRVVPDVSETGSREALHRLVDELPELAVQAATSQLVQLRDDPVIRALELAPLDDEPLTPEDMAAIEEGSLRGDRARGRQEAGWRLVAACGLVAGDLRTQ